MQFKLDRINTSVSTASGPEDKTHQLFFTGVAVDVDPLAPAMYGPSQITLVLTAAEAAEYQLGFVYDLTLSIE